MVHLKDYTPPEFWIRETNLHFDLFEDYARVRSILKFERRTGVKASVIRLDGENLQFKGVKLDGVACEKASEGGEPKKVSTRSTAKDCSSAWANSQIPFSKSKS